MKILYLMDYIFNLGSIFLFDGLTDISDVTIVDGPPLENIISQWYARPNRKHKKVSIEEAQNGSFDLIVIANQHHATLNYMRDLRNLNVPNVIYFNADSPGIDLKIVFEFQPQLCFLREYYYNEQYSSNCIALPFASPMREIVPAQKEREIDILFAMSGQNNPARITWHDILKKNFAHTNSVFNIERNFEQADYFDMLANSKIVIDIRGYGAETARFYEAISYGAFLITNETMLLRPNPFLNHEHICYTEESRVALWCDYYLKNDQLRLTSAANAQIHLQKYHTTVRMAERFLDKVKEIP